MSTMGLGGIDTSALVGGSSAGSSSSSSATSSSAGSTAVKNFMDYMKETPAQRLEDAWLAAHGLTEKDLQSMPADKRQAILKEMADDIKKQVQQATQNALKKNSGANSIAAAISG